MPNPCDAEWGEIRRLERDLAAARLAAEQDAKDAARYRRALQFYAERGHFGLSDESAWDTVSGGPPNFWCDEAGTATIEDGSVAKMALDEPAKFDQMMVDADREASAALASGTRAEGKT